MYNTSQNGQTSKYFLFGKIRKYLLIGKIRTKQDTFPDLKSALQKYILKLCTKTLGKCEAAIPHKH